MSPADVLAHEQASYVRQTPAASKPSRTVLERFPAGGPRGSWPAEEYAAKQRRDGRTVDVVMDLASDQFLVIVEGAS